MNNSFQTIDNALVAVLLSSSQTVGLETTLKED